jgi:hypothetical protein
MIVRELMSSDLRYLIGEEMYREKSGISRRHIFADAEFWIDIRHTEEYLDWQIRRTEECSLDGCASEGVLAADFPKEN